MIKKVLLLLLLFILPFSVYAKEANLELKSIEKVEASSDTVEVSPPTIESSTLSYNLKFTNTNEFIKYKLEIINHDDIDYEIVLESDDEYLSYEISEKEISANKTVETIITIKYTKEMPLVERGEQKVNTSTVVIKDDQGEVVTPTPIENPHTGSYLILIPLLIILAVAIILFRNTKANKVFLLLLLMLPFMVHAAVNLVFTFKVSYEIEPENKLRYRGELIEVDEDLNNEKVLLQNACTSNNNDSNIIFEAVSENSADVTYTFNKEDDINIFTSVSVIKNDNGELSVAFGDCMSNPNMKLDNFSYNGKEIIDNNLISDFTGAVCSKVKAVLETLTPTCTNKLLEDSKPDLVLRYKGKEVNADQMIQSAQESIINKCVNNDYSDNSIIYLTPTSNNSSLVSLVFDKDSGAVFNTSISIETDAETGDERVLTGICASNLSEDDFTFNRSPLTSNAKLNELYNSLCSKLRTMLENTDVECSHKLINTSLKDNTLRYRGYEINTNTLTNQLQNELVTKCSTGNHLSGNIRFEATSSKSADVKYIFDYDDYILYYTSIIIDEDEQTGDLRTVVGECTSEPQMVYNKFTYNGKVIGNLSQLTDFNNSMCAGIRETFESLDLECVESLMRGPK